MSRELWPYIQALSEKERDTFQEDVASLSVDYIKILYNGHSSKVKQENEITKELILLNRYNMVIDKKFHD